MIVTKKHAHLIVELMQKWQDGAPLDKVIDKLTEDDLEQLFQLELAGLVQEEDDRFVLTRAGHLIGEALVECQESTGENRDWDESFKFIGSEVISMIEIARIAQGELSHAPELMKELERRGFAKDGRLNTVAESVLTAYDLAEPSIFISTVLAEKLRKMPPGPGKKSFLSLDRDEIYELEAMRLLTFSLFYGNYYSLTGAGQQIRAGLLMGATPVKPITDEILISLIHEKYMEENREALAVMGLIEDSGNLTPAGERFTIAARLLYAGPIDVNPAVHIGTGELETMNIIEDLWQKYQDNPEIYPSWKKLKEYLSHHKPALVDGFSRAMFTLESYRLVQDREMEKGDWAFELTPIGKEVLEDRQEKGFKPVFSKAVTAITTTRMENISPGDPWVDLAEEQGLLGNGYPSKSGRLFSRLASSILRLPLVDAFQKRVLNIIPYWRGMFIQAILEKFPEKEHEDLQVALDRLVSNGILDLLPGGLYRITDAGEKFKRGLGVVPDGVEFPVTPRVLRVLIAAAEDLDEKGQINWKMTERKSGLSPRDFEDTVSQLRTLLYIKGDKITNAGLLLVEGFELLEDLIVEWEEIEV